MCLRAQSHCTYWFAKHFLRYFHLILRWFLKQSSEQCCYYPSSLYRGKISCWNSAHLLANLLAIRKFQGWVLPMLKSDCIGYCLTDIYHLLSYLCHPWKAYTWHSPLSQENEAELQPNIRWEINSVKFTLVPTRKNELIERIVF